MDEDEQPQVAASKKHDRWSVLVLSLSFATSVTCEAAAYLGNLTEAAAQHANHVIEQNKFHEITSKWGRDG